MKINSKKAIALTRSELASATREGRVKHGSQLQSIYRYANKHGISVEEVLQFKTTGRNDIVKMMHEVAWYFLYQTPDAQYLLVSRHDRICRDNELYKQLRDYLGAHRVKIVATDWNSKFNRQPAKETNR